MKPILSVIICTHNPRLDYLTRVLEALQHQTLAMERWELLVIDNASSLPLADQLDLGWHPRGRLVREERLGLTMARQRGFQEAQADLLVYVDDDNVLAPDYLQQAQHIFDQHPRLGAVGGKVLPEFETPPPAWVRDFYTILALRDFGDSPQITQGDFPTACRHYPATAPAGAGMALRRAAFVQYWQQLAVDPTRLRLGRTGRQLVSGEDNDIVLTLLNQGWDVAYLPQLQLTHLIAAKRLTQSYLARLNYAASQSWVQVLDIHGIRIWPAIPRWSLRLRQGRAWLRLRAWQSPSAYVRWRGACGLLAGQANLTVPTPSWVTQLGLGVVFYRLYHVPRQFLQRCQTQGLGKMLQFAHDQRRMEAAAKSLPPLANRDGEPLEVYYLSGRKFWYQTVFCFHSLVLQTNLHLRLVVVDDGTLTLPYQQAIRRVCPTVRFILADEIEARLEAVLPWERYPTLRSRRKEYPNLRKLTDIHAGTTGWKLVLDSDMLFFRPPVALLDWLQTPQMPCHMVDVETAYGYPSSLLEQLAGVPIPDRINVGITGLCSDALDWDEIEHWCRTQIEQAGSHYYQEQALVAMLMARHPRCIMPAEDYVVMPQAAAVIAPQAQLHHYVADSKQWYFRYGWRHIVAQLATPQAADAGRRLEEAGDGMGALARKVRYDANHQPVAPNPLPPTVREI
ncbi:MAG: glycosyltransferase [Synechococcales bacterium]|nr:glycosyltransferase [Synechococcales bacterium]